MNRLLLLSLLLFLTVFAYAQISTPIEVTTKDGRTVILKPDGTWEVVSQLSPNPVGSVVKSDLTTGSLPPNFVGHNIQSLYIQLLNLKELLIKNEFETTNQYEKRVEEEIQKHVLENLTIKDNFSFVFSGVKAEYNADTQKMQFLLPVEENSIAAARRRISGAYSEDKKTASDLSYVNLYRIEWETEDNYHSNRLGIFFDEVSNLVKTAKDYSQGFLAEVSLNVEEAKRLKNTIKAVVIARLEEPYARGHVLYDGQLQVRIIAVYFFDPQTGKILAEISEAKK